MMGEIEDRMNKIYMTCLYSLGERKIVKDRKNAIIEYIVGIPDVKYAKEGVDGKCKICRGKEMLIIEEE